MLLPNRRRIRTPSPGLPEGSLSPPRSPLHDGLAALHEAATSPERQARALAAAIPRFHDAPLQVGGVLQVVGCTVPEAEPPNWTLLTLQLVSKLVGIDLVA